ncbi:GIY-YIG nuclease family protein [Paraclostridium bifermentans]|jgi:putative endonuclease|uniref:GIY-YIG nuclease family protein n=1 Tax=Paraclostridium TaxID=1849822 RepID=UPI0006B3AA95|nr:GIY-YIG nuclease family protein [Paraclostridium bifermentans]MBS5954164.1 GIY-YIG nuclease family protein [Paraclostridium bifermentans]MBS6508765.1 GIY-YIG nuclease family protein [Paraclostridium bifermentans]MBU5287126.1 GIY-YIG nuclease family protein [Paraclostridium bifermentans]MDU3337272.1 GIY-YIG nuclease family protein [Paraclostridium bifermentans]MDU3803236.1 GIY-YIG nuclease family protein [Paraclostridium bifermentans]
MYYTYIITCKDETYYIGYTSDIKRRINEHKIGKNSKYTRARGFKNLEIYWSSNSRSDAMKLECFLKKLTRLNKTKLINNPSLLYDKYKVDDRKYRLEVLDEL